jgi:hypothetical protein
MDRVQEVTEFVAGVLEERTERTETQGQSKFDLKNVERDIRAVSTGRHSRQASRSVSTTPTPRNAGPYEDAYPRKCPETPSMQSSPLDQIIIFPALHLASGSWWHCSSGAACRILADWLPGSRNTQHLP